MKISDLHTHPSLKPYHNQTGQSSAFQNIWNGVRETESYFYKLSGSIRKQINETSRDSQSHLNEFIAGNIATGAFVIHPVERGWFILPPRGKRWLRKSFLRLILSREKIKYLATSLTGIPLQTAERYLRHAKEDRPVDYYQSETYQEYDYIKNQQRHQGSWEFDFKIVDTYKSYLSAIAEKTIPIFLSLEGGHSLTIVKDGKMFRKEYHELASTEIDSLKASVLRNVGRIKGAKDIASFDTNHTPIYVTLCHMYQNFLSGHARSYKQGKNIAPGMEDLLDQSVGMNSGITQIGWDAIRALTSTENGKRVLIDVKHMSAKARNQYYAYADVHNLPIIASHVAMSGVIDYSESPKDSRKDNDDNYFSRWSINLSDMDAQKIAQSEGLVGISLHEGRMPGGKALKTLKKLKKNIQKGNTVDQHLKKEYIKLIMSNIFQFVKAVNKESAWSRMMIGSDYDGIMNPFDIYPKSSYFKNFVYDMKEYLDNPFSLVTYTNNQETIMSSEEVRHYMYGLSSDQIIRKFANENFEKFIQKNY